jgi:hypothetical protein
MSITEHHIGKLIPVELTGTVEETCQKILQEMGIETSIWYDNFNGLAVNHLPLGLGNSQ